MYLGHLLLAFTLAVFLGLGLGRSGVQALGIGVLAAAFALVPDIDTVYTVYVVVQAGPEQLFPTPKYVWTDESWLVHRALTHSLLVGLAASSSIWLIASSTANKQQWSWRRGLYAITAVGIVIGLLWIGLEVDGLPGVATMVLYLAAAVVLTVLALRRSFSPFDIGGAAAIGLLTHPFGDVFMGRPPIFLYPLRQEPVIGTVVLAQDATVNLIGLVLLEVFLAWSAIWIISRIQGWSIRSRTNPLALVGLGFVVTVPVIRPPTLEFAYHFMLGTITTGVVVGLSSRFTPRGHQRSHWGILITALATVTLAILAYLVVYLVV